jgi:hypothetical protein
VNVDWSSRVLDVGQVGVGVPEAAAAGALAGVARLAVDAADV